MHDWALLIFTICMQAAIGGIVVLSILYMQISKLGKEQTFSAMRIPLLVIAGLSLIGLGASFAHLGAPGNAFNTLRNLGSSWMSREILTTGFFIAAACITAGLAFVQKKVNPFLILVSSLIGLFDIYCMGAIYSSSLMSGWHSINTFTSFYGTALVIGPVLAVSLMIISLKDNSELVHSLIKSAFYISIFGLAVQVIGVALFATTMPEVNMIGGMNALASLDGYQETVALRWVIEILGAGVLGFMSFSNNRKVPLAFAYVALIVLFFAEGMSRYVFYVLGA
jgi:anaerobic dimethyl sulfoxide reductase subunit C (anchor subunit)